MEPVMPPRQAGEPDPLTDDPPGSAAEPPEDRAPTRDRAGVDAPVTPVEPEGVGIPGQRAGDDDQAAEPARATRTPAKKAVKKAAGRKAVAAQPAPTGPAPRKAVRKRAVPGQATAPDAVAAAPTTPATPAPPATPEPPDGAATEPATEPPATPAPPATPELSQATEPATVTPATAEPTATDQASADPASADPAGADPAGAAPATAAPVGAAWPDAHEPPDRAEPVPVPVAGAAPAAPAGIVLWDQLTGNPAHGPELLALAAVERLGPEAARYTRWIRATYPGATADRMAQAAGRRFGAQARRGALAGALAGEIGQAVALGWLQARLVLHIAAAYGRDPRAPERAAELLVLLRVHPSVAAARGGLASARDHGEPAAHSARRRLPAGLRDVCLRGVGRRVVARLVPGGGVLVDMLVNDAMVESLTRRATGFYRKSGPAADRDRDLQPIAERDE
jgi:hypothetical protein